MQFVIPSKGRAGHVKSLEVLPGEILYVPDNEHKYYEVAYPKTKIVPVPCEAAGIS